MKLQVLVVEDNVNAGESLVELLQELGYHGLHVKSAEEGMERVQSDEIDIVLADLNLPGQDGLWLLGKIKEQAPGIPLVMITGNASVDTAVEAIKKGAYDYLSKPIDVNRLEVILTGASRMRRLSLENEMLSNASGDDPFKSMIGESKAMKNLREIIKKVGPTSASVLILGESGTGKELVANALVACSEKSRNPYIKLNSAALPKDTLESELFGHVKGSFTGAIKDRKGRFELAHGGTLFLDEIGDMPMATQVKLLRVLQEGEFERVGGTDVIKVDVRIIAATNQDLLHAVQEGKFREDLYYRLNVIQIEVPPLRERKADIPLLANGFLQSFCGKREIAIDDQALNLMKSYQWPGNIRELRNTMERLSIIVSKEVIELTDLPHEIREGAAGLMKSSSLPLNGTMEEIERKAIIDALKSSGGVKSEAAKKLGIGLKTLYRKLDKYEEEGLDMNSILES